VWFYGSLGNTDEGLQLVWDVTQHHSRSALPISDDVPRLNVVEFKNSIAHFTLSGSDQLEGGRVAGSAAIASSENAFEFRIQHAKSNVLSNDRSPLAPLNIKLTIEQSKVTIDSFPVITRGVAGPCAGHCNKMVISIPAELGKVVSGSGAGGDRLEVLHRDMLLSEGLTTSAREWGRTLCVAAGHWLESGTNAHSNTHQAGRAMGDDASE
jgi:hypothetical protein